MNKSIKVKIVKETNNRVTLRFMSTNSRMPGPRDEFEKRVEDGTYEVLKQFIIHNFFEIQHVNPSIFSYCFIKIKLKLNLLRYNNVHMFDFKINFVRHF